MASTTSTLKAISSLKLPNPRSPSSSQTQRLLGFNLSQYPFSTQDLHQHFSTTRHSKSITIKASLSPIKRKRTSSKVQELYVYEMNDGNPGYLKLSEKPVNSVGDLVPFGNKIYTGDLKKRLGITAGVLIKHVPEKSGHQYEAIYSFYFAEYGHVSVQGKYLSSKDTHLEVTGGSGIFRGVSGHVKLQLIVFPFKLFYTFHLEGIPDLPPELMGEHVIPTPSVEPSPAAKATQPRAIITNFTLSC